VATEIIFNPSFAENQRHMTPQSQWNSSLSIGWCLFNPYGRIRVIGSCLLGPRGCQWQQKSFSTQVLLKINAACHHRANETLPCQCNNLCWIDM
jgi:hypothetical protein